LRSKGKLILEDSNQVRDKEKSIPGNVKRLSGNADHLSEKIEPKTGSTESEPGKRESSSGKEKPVLGNAIQLPGNVDRLLEKADPEVELSLGKAELGPSYGCGLREELEPILGKENNEESVTKKSESGNNVSPVDE
jgi:hypothetical protein